MINSILQIISGALKGYLGFNILKLIYLFLGFSESLFIYLQISYVVVYVVFVIIAFPLMIDRIKLSAQNKKLQNKN